jgi:magnesium-transporting ATPase (P-type)
MLVGRALLNPLVVLLALLAAMSFLTNDLRAGMVMVFMIVLGVVLRFAQESRAEDAAAQLESPDSCHFCRTTRWPATVDLPRENSSPAMSSRCRPVT